MAKAKKTSSGKWRVRVYSHTDSDGKKHYKSITSSSKAEASAMAAEFEMNKKRIASNYLKIHECIENYIKIKEAVLSPATIRGYRALARNSYKSINNIFANSINDTDIQLWINEISVGHSPKYVKNAYALLVSSIKFSSPQTIIRATLPRHIPYKGYIPSTAEINLLINYIRKNCSADLERAVLLGAFGPLRRGEICALTYGDIDEDVIHINKDIVRSYNGEWITKPPKTLTSIRSIQMPHEVIKKLGSGDPNQLVVPLCPDALTSAFSRAVKRAGLPHFRFHDLRHYAVSILHAIGIADIYIQERGGWSKTGGNVMRTVYLSALPEESRKANEKANTALKNLINMT